MFAPIFEAIDVPVVRALLKAGTGPVRFYLFGMAPQNVIKPYAVWRMSSGSPENYLGDRPDIDSFTLQVDVFASPTQGAKVCREVAAALRDAIEPHAHITSWLGESIDPETQNYRLTFLVDWWTNRE